MATESTEEHGKIANASLVNSFFVMPAHVEQKRAAR
jgi:hypothetical protein